MSQGVAIYFVIVTMLSSVASICILITSLRKCTAQMGPMSQGGDNENNLEYCTTDSGIDSTYTETIVDDPNGRFGKGRRIVASGCPNYATEPVGDNPNGPAFMNKDNLIEAYPCIADATHDLMCVGAEVATALNGVSIFSPNPYPEGGCSYEVDAVGGEGDTFDECSGHANEFGNYHYHVAPACLLEQLGDSEDTNTHSPIIGWAFDGFPIYGPHGVDGSEIYGCAHPDADDADCVDSCNGHDQHVIDGYLYHYHILGPIGDGETRPTSPLPSTDMRPYTLGCLRGVPSDWGVITGDVGSTTCVSNGTVDGFVPLPAGEESGDVDNGGGDSNDTSEGCALKVSAYLLLALLVRAF